jgi:hypothetical protein
MTPLTINYDNKIAGANPDPRCRSSMNYLKRPTIFGAGFENVAAKRRSDAWRVTIELVFPRLQSNSLCRVGRNDVERSIDAQIQICRWFQVRDVQFRIQRCAGPFLLERRAGFRVTAELNGLHRSR